jgi:hypothetical protein
MENMKYLLFSTILFFSAVNAFAQCNASLFSQDCVTKVQDGFTFLKSFNIDSQNGAKDKVEYSYVFSKDTQYYLNICTTDEDKAGIVVTIYDANRKQASTNLSEGKLYQGLIFECKSTGIYYITYTFKNSPNPCGGSVLAFRR